MANLWDQFTGQYDENAVHDTMMDNSAMTKMSGYADEFMDWGSDYYKRGKEYFADIFGQQAMDTAWSATRMNNINLNKQGIDTTGGIAHQTNRNIFSDFGTKALNMVKTSLFDMWGKGQDIAQGYYGQVADIISSANAAKASQASANASSSSGGFGDLIDIGFKIAALASCDERLKENVEKIEGVTLYGLPVYRFDYKDKNLGNMK